jgi:hypothetical protein
MFSELMKESEKNEKVFRKLVEKQSKIRVLENTINKIDLEMYLWTRKLQELHGVSSHYALALLIIQHNRQCPSY